MIVSFRKESIKAFNLIYHVAPFIKSNIWKQNIRQLLKRIHIFNNKRVVAIVTGENMVSPAEVKLEFEGQVENFLEIPNNVLLRERTTFFPLLEQVQSLNPSEATFYAHTKGVYTIGNLEAVMYWRNAMYHYLLDDPEQVKEILLEYPIIGTFRMNKEITYPDNLAKSPWHFSGTFFWFRNDALFSRDWKSIPESGWAVEAMPGLLFDINESYCLAFDNPKHAYNLATYEEKDRIADPEGPGESVVLKVELGGGLTPKGDKFINVDKLSCADIQFDFETISAQVKLPFADNSVVYLYTSHCIEHVDNLVNLMREIVRVCHLGAMVEICAHYWQHHTVTCHSRKNVISPELIKQWTETELDHWWGNSPKCLKLFHQELTPSKEFHYWQRLLSHASQQDIMEMCPGACQENRWVFHVVKRQSRCRVCSSLSLVKWLNTSDGPWFRCEECKSDSSTLFYEDIKSRYDATYLNHNLQEFNGDFRRCIQEMTTNLDCFGQFTKKPGLFLDIGSAEGASLTGMEERGWQVWGFDVIPEAKRENVIVSPEFKADLFQQKFDAIMLREVLEHIEDWRGLLSQCRQALTPNGLLQVQTPIPLEKYDPLPYHWAHLQIFAPKILQEELIKAGFKILASHQWDLGQLYMCMKSKGE